MELFIILGGIALLIFALKLLTTGIQKLVGRGLRNIISKMSSNKYSGAATGFLISSLLHSSTAVVNTVARLLNVGIIGLDNAMAVICGANIGATFIIWFVSIISFYSKGNILIWGILALSTLFLISSKSKIRSFSETLLGTGLLLLAFLLMKEMLPVNDHSLYISHLIDDLNNIGIFTYIIAILIGIILTYIVQSSTISILLCLIAFHKNWMTLPVALFTIVGANIGTAINPELNFIKENPVTRRVRRFQIYFNLIGGIWSSILLLFVIPVIIHKQILNNIYSLLIFNSLFNAVNALLLLNLIPVIKNKIIKDISITKFKRNIPELDLRYSGIVSTQELSIIEVKQVFIEYSNLIKNMFSFLKNLLQSSKERDRKNFYSEAKKMEDLTDKTSNEISFYLGKLMEEELSEDTIKEARTITYLSSTFEIISDDIYKIVKQIKEIWFLPQQRKHLIFLIKDIEKMYEIIQKLFLKKDEKDNLYKYNEKINNNLLNFKKEYSTFINISYNPKAGMIYYDIISTFDKIRDYLFTTGQTLIYA